METKKARTFSRPGLATASHRDFDRRRVSHAVRLLAGLILGQPGKIPGRLLAFTKKAR
jgi:hypothetical protein